MHRGTRSHFPNNTVAAFEGAPDHGCVHFENRRAAEQRRGVGVISRCVLLHDSLDTIRVGSGMLEEVRSVFHVCTCCQAMPLDAFLCRSCSLALHSHATSLSTHVFMYVVTLRTPELLLGRCHVRLRNHSSGRGTVCQAAVRQ